MAIYIEQWKTEGWKVSIGQGDDGPLNGGDGGEVAIGAGAVATLSRGLASHWRSVRVAAGTCVDAETAATAAISKDDCAIQWLQRRRLAARLVEVDGTVHYVGPWPDPTREAA